jgi:uracil-DNA glycosylase
LAWCQRRPLPEQYAVKAEADGTFRIVSMTGRRGVRPNYLGEARFASLEEARHGVLLLNTVLTVRDGSPNSHAKEGWEDLTMAVIRAVNHTCEGVVFMLWGKPAQRVAKLVDTTKHKVLLAAHPSPLSVHRGFSGCKHFSQANEWLVARKREPVRWELE